MQEPFAPRSLPASPLLRLPPTPAVGFPSAGLPSSRAELPERAMSLCPVPPGTAQNESAASVLVSATMTRLTTGDLSVRSFEAYIRDFTFVWLIPLSSWASARRSRTRLRALRVAFGEVPSERRSPFCGASPRSQSSYRHVVFFAEHIPFNLLVLPSLAWRTTLNSPLQCQAIFYHETRTHGTPFPPKLHHYSANRALNACGISYDFILSRFDTITRKWYYTCDCKGEIMSITLSVPPTVVQEVRLYADKKGTSLNQMIRDYLQSMADASRREREELANATFDFLMSQDDGGLPRNWRFNRDEANARG